MYVFIIRTVIIYTVVIFAVRLMGKRQISQLQTSELVVTMLISDLAVIPMQDGGQPLFSGILPIFVLISLEIFLSILMLKSRNVRRIVSGNPVVVIKDGQIIQANMKALRLSIEELFEQLRQKDVFSILDVAYAILETNGSLSVMKYASADYIRPADAGIIPQEFGPNLAVVCDGKFSKDAIKLSGYSENEIRKIIKKEKTSISEVFVLTIDPYRNYTLIKRDKAK